MIAYFAAYFCHRLLAVTGFSTHIMADFSVPMRFENFSYATNFIGAKNPGIRIEILAKQRTDRKKPLVRTYVVDPLLVDSPYS